MNSIISIVGKALAGGLALALMAAPAAVKAADADLAVTITGVTTIGYGQTGTFSIEVDNTAGPSTARGITMAKPTLDTHFTILAVSNCILRGVDPSADASWPCTIPDIQDGTSSTVGIDVALATPDPFPTTCTGGTALTATSVTVSTSGTTDPNLANNTATTVSTLAGFADLQIGVVPGAFAVGGDAVFTVTVTNNGPCAATRVLVTDTDFITALVAPGVTANAATYVWKTTTGGVCDGNDPVWDGCLVGAMAPAATATFVSTYTVEPMLKDMMQSTYPYNLDVADTTRKATTTPPAPKVNATFDQGSKNNAVTLTHTVTQSVSSCSTGGAPGILGLLALGLLPLVRRRRQG